MRILAASAALLVLVPLLGADPVPAKKPEKKAAKKAEKADYREFSKLVHSIIVKQAPRTFEDSSGWGGTIPVPPNLLLPGVRRTFVKVGKRYEMPHGAWHRFKGRIVDPKRDVKVRVREFRRLDDGTYRLLLDGEATVACAGEWQQWVNGLLIVGANARGKATMAAAVDCNVKVAIKLGTFPPALAVEPTIKELKVDVKDFAFQRPPGVSAGQRTVLEQKLREVLNGALQLFEPTLKKEANEAIGRALHEGKGTISAAELFRLQKAPAK